MDTELMGWKNEMENMLAAINRQTTHSLRVIRLIFKRCGQSLPPEFKQYFLQVTSNSIKTTYKQFEIDAMLEESMNVNLNSLANVAEGLLDESQSEVTSEGSNSQDDVIQIDDLIDEVIVTETVESQPTLFSELVANDGLRGINEINESTVHQSDTNENYFADPQVKSDLHFAMEMDDSNDSVATDDNDVVLENTVFDNKSTIAELTEETIETMRLNRKNSSKKRRMKMDETNEGRDSLTAKDEKSPSKQSLPKNQKRCSVCENVYSTNNFSRHMRTHTGEKPHRCSRCGRSFTSAASLMKHAVTHIAEFPFNCRICFLGFPLKAKATVHERQCRKRHFECHLCKKFLTCAKSDLIRHMRHHSGNKPFRCEICMKHFCRKHDLKRHLNTIHA